MSTPIKAIVFDAYGTLLNVGSIQAILDTHFQDKAESIGTIWRQKQLEYTWLRSLMGRYKNFEEVTKDALVYACSAMDQSLSTTLSQKLMEAYKRLLIYPEVALALDSLMLTPRFKIAVLSNANQHLLEKAIRFNEIDDSIEEIISADDLGIYKPSPKVYELACKRLKLSSNEIAFVSSNTWDIAGAKSYGFQVIWVNRSNKAVEELGFPPDFIVSNLLEIPTIYPVDS